MTSTAEVQPFKIGDAIIRPALLPNWVEPLTTTYTLVQIIPLPEDPVEREKTIQTSFEAIRRTHRQIVAGANLADDPQYEPRADRNVLYVFES